MSKVNLKPSHQAVQDYYDQLQAYADVGAEHEGAVRTAFRDLLNHGGKQMGWTLVPEKTLRENGLRPDGVLVDHFDLRKGFWEAKDSADDLDHEIQKKINKGYPTNNIIFQEPNRAVLVQDGGIVFDADITDPQHLVDCLRMFFDYEEPAHEEWEAAVSEFKDRVPDIGQALRGIIEDELDQNASFREAFSDFFALCQQAINPNLSREAVEEMLIQHLLTSRLFRTVFQNDAFVRRNIIAREIEQVIDALTSRSFSRTEFLKPLDRFYLAIENAADAATDFSEKQEFLNTVYEQFFQGFAVDVADTHGIVYTPQPIVDFMTNSVTGLLQEEFGVSIGDSDVHVLDPFTGTGNFIVRLMQEIPRRQLPQKYGAEGDPELHANEVMLLPYYIASLNIEHAYYERMSTYEPFQGVCLVDTFEAEDQRQSPQLFTPENTERVKQQQEQSITVVIGNPPYNAWQVNANDNNQNRSYERVDSRVKETYVSDSSATLKNALYDPYVKAIRWATDRIGDEGIVAYVTNNSFVDNLAFDGMRKHLSENFDAIYVLDCGGNVRKNPKLSGTTHNVFGIQVGVSVTFFVKHADGDPETCDIRYFRMEEFLTKEERYAVMNDAEDWRGIEWEELEPDAKHRWLVEPTTREFESYLPIGSKEAKKAEEGNAEAIFKFYSNGIKTNNDAFIYDFSEDELRRRAKSMVKEYNNEYHRWQREGQPTPVKDFLNIDEKILKWVRNTRRHLKRGSTASFSESGLRRSIHRPYVRKACFFDKMFSEDVYRFPRFYPSDEQEIKNHHIWLKVGAAWPVFGLMSNCITDLLPQSGSQCFPFYVYDEDGTNRRENVTDWALERFRSHYDDATITKRDIFHYVYGVLHHTGYRERYKGNLKRQLPRIPFAPNTDAFRSFVEAGAQLAELHVGYEDAEPYPLNEVEDDDADYEWRVEKMRFRQNKTAIKYNDFLTLEDIPERAHDYRLGNRSALEWLVNQYRVRTYKRYDITHDPNDPNNKWYIVDLIKRVTTVSIKTVDIVEGLPELGLPEG